MATLPTQRFRDLASDVYFELDRRYPEFGDGEVRLAFAFLLVAVGM